MWSWIVLAACQSRLVELDPIDRSPAADPEIETLPGGPAEEEDVDDGCPAVYDEDVLPDFALELSDVDWAALQADYGTGTKAYHAASFTGLVDGEVETLDAAVRLSGNPGFSWIGPKMQFTISFTEADPDARYKGLRKLKLDASWYDPTLLRDRLAYAYLRDLGVAAPCANNATLSINGAYYGLYKNIEEPDQEFLQRVMGQEDSVGTLWKYGTEPAVNEEVADHEKLSAFWATTDVAWQEANTDLEGNLLEWAGEALIPQDDGYWCCAHNFYIYEHPAKGLQFLPWDMDYTFDSAPYFADPDLFYRDSNGQGHLDAVAADPVWGPRWDAALRTATDGYDADLFATRIAAWSAQIADAFAADPNTTISPGAHSDAIERLPGWIRSRSAFMRSWVAATPIDADGDGYTTGQDCDDDDAEIHAGAVEACNRRDDDCNGIFDDANGCDTCDEYSFGSSRFLVCGQPVTHGVAQEMCAGWGGALGYPVSTEDWYLLVYTTYWQEHAWSGYSSWWADPGGGGCVAMAPASWGSTTVACETELPVICRLE